MSAVTLAEVKSHLSIVDGANDADLQLAIDAAELAIAAKCGPLSSTAKTERLRGGGPGLVLRNTPVVSLTSVTPLNGTAYTVTDFETDLSAGVIEWSSGGSFATGIYVVVYQAGRATLPADLKMGIKELVRHTWGGTKRGGRVRPGSLASEQQSNTLESTAFQFVYRVQEYIHPHIQVGN